MLTTLQGINSNNYNQTGFYYKLFNNNNRVAVVIQAQNNTSPVGNNYVEISMDGQRWFINQKITTINSNIYDYQGISAIRINPDPASPPFLMQIFEGAVPITYRERG